MFLYDASLEKPLGRFAATDPTDKQGLYDQGFVCQAERGEDGRLLCLVAEPGVRLKWFAPNLICWSDGTPLEPGRRPPLRCIACLKPDLRVEASFPYIHLADCTRTGKDHRPTPSLEQQVRDRLDLFLYNPWIGQALPLAGGRALVTLFSGQLRGGSKGNKFIFVMLDSDGNLCRCVDEIDRHDESPYVDHHYRLAIDRAHQRIVYKNKTSFFLFDWNGKLLTQVKLDQPNLRPLSAWKLGCCGPDGSIVLHQPNQELLLSVDPVSDPLALGTALVEAQEFVKKERTRLKKRYEAVGSRWLHPGPIVRQ